MKRKKLISLIGGVLCIAMLATAIVPNLIALATTPIEVLNPWGEIQPQDNLPLAERPSTLNGGNIGLIYFDKLGGPEFTAAVKNLLQGAYTGLTFEETVLDTVYAFAQSKEWYDEKGASYDAVVISVADDNISAYWGSYHARELEKRGVPVVVAVSSAFVPTLALSAEDHGITALRSVVLPIEAYSHAYQNMSSRIVPLAESLLPALTGALLDPLTAAEQAPAQIEPKDALENITIPALSYAKQIQYFDALAMEEGFGDGLPLSLPTREAVDEMLAATERQPDEVLGKLRMRYGLCTIEKIAINAVMAGAEPEFFPVIIAAMEALVDGIEDKSLYHAALTTGEEYTLMMLVSGPIAKELDFATDRGYMTSGRKSSTTIGRAVRLAFQNIGHNTKPYVDTSRSGRTNDHTGLIFTENVNQFPRGWISHGESMGYSADQSSITVTAIGRMTEDDAWVNNEPFSYLIPELLLTPGQFMLKGRETYLTSLAVRRMSNIPTNPKPSEDLMIYTLSPAHAALLLEEPETDYSTTPYDYGTPIPPGSGIGIGTPSASDPLGLNKSKLGHITGGTKEGIREWFTKNGVKAGTTGANAASTAQINMDNVRDPDIPFAAHKNVIQLFLCGENPTYSLIYQSKFLGMDAYRTQLVTGATLTDAGRDATAPSQPQAFTAVATGANQATLTWEAPARANGEISYDVSSDDGATWVNVGAETSYVFNGLDSGEDYRFVVRAVNGADNARIYGEDFELSNRGSGRGAQARATVILPTTVKLNSAALVTLRNKQTLQLGAIVAPAGADPALIWTSTNTNFATVDENGLVTAKAIGTVVITLKTVDGSLSNTVTIRITA